MKLSATTAATAVLASASLVTAQTYSNCNPRETTDCPPDTALGKAATYDLTKGAPNGWTATGTVDYSDQGGAFTVSQSGDAPLLTSDFYIMWGHVEYVLKAAPGTGIISSAVMQSDTLDEIDWEFLGGDSGTVQTNYFGHADTSEYNREQTFSTPDNQADFHTYAVDWTADRIVWQIDGTTVRTLTPATADSGQYPQTPMMIKVGIWAGGDPSNPQGTIDWAGGETDFSKGPFTMYCESVAVTDYSTGTEYKYTSESGTSDSISAVGGSVGGNAGATASVATEAASPTVTSSDGEAPMPWSGTHRETSVTSHTGWPWVSTATATLTNSDPSDYSSGAGSTLAPPTVASTSPPTGSPYPLSSASSSLSGGESTTTALPFPTTTAAATSKTSTTRSKPSSSLVPPYSSIRSFSTSTSLGSGSQPGGGNPGSTSTTTSPTSRPTATTPPAPTPNAGNQLAVGMGEILASFGCVMALL